MAPQLKELSMLWDKACEGDYKAFAAIHKKLHSKMYSSAIRLVKDVELTEDILQETFIKLWSRRETIGHVENVPGYFFMTTRSICLSYIKASRTIQLKFEPIEVANFPEPVQTSIEDTITERETESRQKKIIETALKHLPTRQREIIRLRFYDSLNCKEIEKITGIQYQSVVNQMSRGVQKLRDFQFLKSQLSLAVA